MKKIKKVLALLLAVMLVLSCSAVAFAADADKTPVIIIPGFGQSEVKVYDDDGTYLGDISTFDLPGLDVTEIVKALASPAIMSVFSRKDVKLSETVSNYMAELFKPFTLNDDGTPAYNKVIRQFAQPYSKLPAEDRAAISQHVVLASLSQYDDVRYYFTYDTFGSVKKAADDLHNYVKTVLDQTGASQVSLVPLSQGGTVLTEYLDLYPEDYGYIKKIVNMVPAFDGSEIVGNILLDNVTVYDINKLHREIIPSLLGQTDTAYQISLAVRLALTPSVQQQVLKSAVAAARDILAVNSSSMWALCPAKDYEAARDLLLSDEAHAALRAETDRYNEARKNLPQNFDKLMENGTVIHIIASYDRGYYLSSLFDCGVNDADELLNPSSPSLGATAAPFGGTLGNDYVSPQTYCSDPNHNHISPDNMIDASTGYLPENTWYFKGVTHMGLNGREDVKNFAAQFIMDEENVMTDIYSYPGHSQFTDPKDNIASSVVNEATGSVSYYDEDGNYLYSETPANDKPVKFSFWKLLYCLFNIMDIVFEKLAFWLG